MGPQLLSPACMADAGVQLDVYVLQMGAARSRLKRWREGMIHYVNWLYRDCSQLQRRQQPRTGYEKYLSSCGGPATVKRKRPRLCTHSRGAGCRDCGSGDRR
jgi:hypothetical protein